MKMELQDKEAVLVRKAIQVYRAALVRSRTKEVPGSEIFELRGREIQAVDVLASKLG